MGLSLPFFFPLSKGKLSGIAQLVWQVIPTFSVGGLLAHGGSLLHGAGSPLSGSRLLGLSGLLGCLLLGGLSPLGSVKFLGLGGLLGIDLRDNLGESKGALTLRVLQRILPNNTIKGGHNAGVNHLLSLDGFRDLDLDGLGSLGGCNSIVS